MTLVTGRCDARHLERTLEQTTSPAERPAASKSGQRIYQLIPRSKRRYVSCAPPSPVSIGGIRTEMPNPDIACTAGQTARIRVEIRETHAYAGTKFAGVRDSSDPKLDFDVFISVELLSETPSSANVRDCHLKISLPDGVAITGEWIKGDLENWRMQTEKEEWDLWDTWTTTVRAPIAELNTAEPLQYGVPRLGWLHFRVRDITASQLQKGSMDVSVENSLAETHVGSVSLLGKLSYPLSAGRIVPLDAPPSG